jgi:signal transduction histidine kinase
LKIWTNITQFFVFLFLIELIIFAFDGNHALLWKTQSYFTILRFTLSLVCIYNIRYIHSPLRSFYLVGTLLLWIGVLIGKIFPPNWVNPDIIYLNPYFYLIALFMFENVCFTIGLSHRSNLILIQKQEQINQERLEKEQIRNHIAADLHDDLGAGLSTIRLLGERAQFSTNFDEKNNQIEKMTEQAQSLIEKMSTIIWAMNSEKDTIESLVQYLRFFAFDYLQDTHTLKLQFPVPNLPPSVSEQNLTGDTRREVFLTVKEALHNIVKHAQTSCVLMSIQLKNNDLEIIIKDNGKGLKVENSIGNGLKNMAKRMNKLGGDFQISTNDTTGVNIVLSLPLTKVRS